jgi:heat shock protein HspQ
MDQSSEETGRTRTSLASATLPGALASAPLVTHAHFRLGDTVRHKLFGFRGVVFDVDPAFANSEEWYDAIPEEMRPDRNQPFYHLLADNGESSYIAYVSQQNLTGDDGTDPIDHPAIPMMFKRLPEGGYKLDSHRWH